MVGIAIGVFTLLFKALPHPAVYLFDFIFGERGHAEFYPQGGKITMMKVLEGKQALVTLTRGVTELSRLVATTYGPNGSKVAVSKNGRVLVTTDGSALAHEVRFRDLHRLGASLVRGASSKVDRSSGDGTSTTILLTGALLEAALDHYSPRTWNPVAIARDIQGFLPAVEGLLTAMSRAPDEGVINRVAEMASHGDKMVSGHVVNAVLRVGENGTVLVRAGDGVGIEMDHREGLVLDVGWASHAMGKGDGTPREMEGPMVAVVNHPLSSFEDVRTIMEEASQWPGRGLVLFCPKLTGDALTTLILNDAKGVLPCIAVTYFSPSLYDTHEWLEDVATVTNAVTVGTERGDNHREFKAEWLGSARRITVEKDKTEIHAYPDAGDRVAARVAELHRRAVVSTSDYDHDRYQERGAAMAGGLCTLKVGGYTTPEAQDRRSRVEDSLHAVQETLRTGVVPGAGRALHFVSTMPELQETLGGQVLARALEEPLRVLCARSETAFSTLSLPSDDPWVGWCPVRRDVADFWKIPSVVDPLGVVLASLRAAVSVACTAMTTSVVIVKSQT